MLTVILSHRLSPWRSLLHFWAFVIVNYVYNVQLIDYIAVLWHDSHLKINTNRRISKIKNAYFPIESIVRLHSKGKVGFIALFFARSPHPEVRRNLQSQCEAWKGCFSPIIRSGSRCTTQTVSFWQDDLQLPFPISSLEISAVKRFSRKSWNRQIFFSKFQG
jgi:hypothetical protein